MAVQEQNIRWDLLSLGSLIPDEVAAVVDSANDVVSTLQSVINVVGGVLDLLSTLLVADLDLTKAAILALVETVEAAIAFLESTQISITWYIPTSKRNAPNVLDVLEKVALSFQDESDAQRPVATNVETYFAMWFAIATASSLPNIDSALAPLLAFFNRPAPEPGEEQLSQTRTSAGASTDRVWPPVLPIAQGQAPDWSTMRLADLGPVSDVVTSLRRILDSVNKSAGDNVDQIQARVQLILDRVTAMEVQVQAVLDGIQGVVDMSEALLESGMTSLTMFGQGDTTDQQATLRRASSRPDFPYKGVRRTRLCGTFGVHAQSDSAAVIEVFRALFNIRSIGEMVIEAEVVSPITASADSLKSDAKILAG